MKYQKYGVGYGPALYSRRVGDIRKAARELVRMIRAGHDPRTVGILPVERCRVCEYRPNPICRGCNGFNYTVAAGDPARNDRPVPGNPGNRDVLPQTTITFLSGPRANANKVRSYLFKRDGEPSAFLIRVIPAGPGVDRITCDCTAGRAGGTCEHITAVGPLDRKRFAGEQKQNETIN